MRPVFDPTGGPDVLVEKMVGKAYDTVRRVSLSLPEIKRLDNVLEEIPVLAENTIANAIEEAMPVLSSEITEVGKQAVTDALDTNLPPVMEEIQDKVDHVTEVSTHVDTKANEVTSNTLLAATSAQAAVNSSSAAEVSKNLAEIARDAAQLSSGIYATTAEGLTKTEVGRYFSTPSPDSREYLILYKNNAGVALQISAYPSAAAITELGVGTMNPEANDLSFAIVDQFLNASWLQANLAGKPSKFAAKCIGETLLPEDAPVFIAGAAKAGAEEVGAGEFPTAPNDISFVVSDALGRRSDLELDLQGRFSLRVVNSLRQRMGAATEVPPFPINAWAAWGDSLTAGGWPTTLAELSGLPVYNGGWGGQGSRQIAARSGGVPAQLTVTGNSIPTSGSVVISSLVNNPLSDGGNRQGYLVGVLGVLAMAGGVVTFTRTAAGSAVACPPASYFTPLAGVTNADRHVIIWSGRNSFKDTSPEVIVSLINDMIAYLTPRVKRVIVMSIPPWVGEENGKGFRLLLDKCNAALAAAFPAFWLDISAWLRTTAAATAAGITFTADDMVDITNGLTPRSLRSDAGHLNAQGNAAVAYRINQESKIRGWN